MNVVRLLTPVFRLISQKVAIVIDNILAIFRSFRRLCRPGSVVCDIAELARIISRLIGKTGRQAFGELRFRGLVRNRPLRELTHNEIYRAFVSTQYLPSSHAIKRLKDIRTFNLGVRTLRDFGAHLNKGVIRDAGRGVISIVYGNFEVIVNPITKVIVTFKPI